MAGCALTIGIMLALRRVTRQTESAVGHEARNGRLTMTGGAGHVRIGGIGVRRAHVYSMAPDAVAPCLVVILMTCGASDDGRFRVERDGDRVACCASDARVDRVCKRDRSHARRAVAHSDCDGRRLAVRQLVFGVAGRAVTRCRRLVMTDLAAAGRLERETPVAAAGDVTGEAGDLFMAIVGEGVGRSWEPGARSWSCPRRVRVALPLPFRLRRNVQRRTPQRLRRVEGRGQMVPPPAAAIHFRMAAAAIAGVHRRRVWLMAKRAALRHVLVP